MNFEKLLMEYEFAQIIERVNSLDPFEIVRFDKTNKIELRIGGKHCDNGCWRNDYYCYIDGAKKCGDYYGFAFPYQQAEFLKLTYSDVAKAFACYGYKVSEIQQTNMFALLKGVI